MLLKILATIGGLLFVLLPLLGLEWYLKNTTHKNWIQALVFLSYFGIMFTILIIGQNYVNS
jgi:hypothetical protein